MMFHLGEFLHRLRHGKGLVLYSEIPYSILQLGKCLIIVCVYTFTELERTNEVEKFVLVQSISCTTLRDVLMTRFFSWNCGIGSI